MIETISLEELEETVTRMEERLRAIKTPMVAGLYGRYLIEKQRFERDLPERRDFLLSCAGALMLIQSVSTEKDD